MSWNGSLFHVQFRVPDSCKVHVKSKNYTGEGFKRMGREPN